MGQLASPYQIGGQLNFQPGGNPLLGVMAGPAGLAQQYGASYNSALQTNQSNYNNILSGYQNIMGQQQNTQSTIGNEYGSLMSGISNTLGANYGVPGVNNQWGIAAPAASAIQKLYSAQSGQQFDANGNPIGKPTGGSIGQGLINSGLGNTTAAPNAQSQATAQYGTAIGGLGAQLAQTYAGYQSGIGQAYLGQQQQESQNLAAEGNQQLGFMNSVQAPYPNGQEYNQLYQQYGQQQANAQNMALLQQQLQVSGALGPKMASAGSGGGVSTPQMPGGGTYGAGGGSFPSGNGVSPSGYGLPGQGYSVQGAPGGMSFGGGSVYSSNPSSGYGGTAGGDIYGGMDTFGAGEDIGMGAGF